MIISHIQVQYISFKYVSKIVNLKVKDKNSCTTTLITTKFINFYHALDWILAKLKKKLWTPISSICFPFKHDKNHKLHSKLSVDLSTIQAAFLLIRREIYVSRGINLKLKIYIYVIMLIGTSTKHQACREYVVSLLPRYIWKRLKNENVFWHVWKAKPAQYWDN